MITVKSFMSKRKFTKEEDTQIRQLVKIYGARNWDLIASSVPGRTGKQCRDRYQNYLSSKFFNGQWTKEEDELLKEKHNLMGCQWSKMVEFFPRRSAGSLRNRWNYFVRNSIIGDESNNNSDYQISSNLNYNQFYNQYYAPEYQLIGNNLFQIPNNLLFDDLLSTNNINYQHNELRVANLSNAVTQTIESSFDSEK